MNLFPHPDQTITGLIPRIRTGELTSVDLTQRCLNAIDELEPRIHAWVLVDGEQALASARACDAELQSGIDRGPLHGIPLGIKDIFDVKGWPTAAGSAGWRDRIAGDDAAVVMRLRAAGAVLIGKTVTTPYASFDPPVTRNPWDTTRTPGGSSSGSAAAVAAGMCVAALGSQTGGSITRPASYCGVAGCKPTYGRVSVRGVLPLAPSMDHPGPIARCVDDLTLLYEAIAGYESDDPYSIDLPVVTGEGAMAEAVVAPRLGLLGGLFVDLVEPEMRQGLGSALDRLSSHGAVVRPAELPPQFETILASHRLIMGVEAAAIHEERLARHPEEYGKQITGLMQEGLRAKITDYVRAREQQVITKRTILKTFADVDVLVCPATTGPAPDAATTGNPACNSPWSYCGLPTVSFPIGFSSTGLPLALQLVGRPFEEQRLFQVSRWCERVLRTESR